MRIVAGEWRGRKLAAPAGLATRPTAERTREALFSILASRVGNFTDLRVLDLFAGTGALGLEALSRGAGHATFIEQDRTALAPLRANIASLKAEARTTVLPTDATRLGQARDKADLAFLDPPYGEGLADKALAALDRGGWLNPHALVSVETGADEPLSHPAYTLETERRYGKALLRVLRYGAGSAAGA